MPNNVERQCRHSSRPHLGRGGGGEGGSVYVQLVRDLLGVHHPKKTTHWRHTIVRQHDHSPNVAAHTQEHTHHTRTHAHAHTHTHTARIHTPLTHSAHALTHARRHQQAQNHHFAHLAVEVALLPSPPRMLAMYALQVLVRPPPTRP
jgi:hypothetical protein